MVSSFKFGLVVKAKAGCSSMLRNSGLHFTYIPDMVKDRIYQEVENGLLLKRIDDTTKGQIDEIVLDLNSLGIDQTLICQWGAITKLQDSLRDSCNKCCFTMSGLCHDLMCNFRESKLHKCACYFVWKDFSR